MLIITEDGEKLPQNFLETMEKGANLSLEKEGIATDRIEISLTLVNKEEIKELNSRYRDKNKATDVLSFPQFEKEEMKKLPTFGPIVLGDVVICQEVAKEQAQEFGHSLSREMTYLFVHSVFHLLGYDHETEAEKKEMRQKEEEVMELLDL